MTIVQLLTAETIHRICDENIPRIRLCLNDLEDDQIWHRPNPELVSIGNLVLHLNGNVRQWILLTLCKQDFLRQRDLEFSTLGPFPKTELLNLLSQLDQDLRKLVPHINEEDLLATYDVQVFRETGVGVLVHCIEHFSYHTGQIARETKRYLNKDLAFYDQHNL